MRGPFPSHPPYYTDLDPSDYFVSKRFGFNDKIIALLNRYFGDFDKSYCLEGDRNLEKSMGFQETILGIKRIFTQNITDLLMHSRNYLIFVTLTKK